MNRALFDRAAAVLSSQLPINLPVPSQFTEEEDLEHLNNLRRLSFLLSGSSTNSSSPPEVRKICGLESMWYPRNISRNAH